MGPPTTDKNLLTTLEVLAHEDPLNDWIFSRIRSYVGGRILEVGCGIGTFTHRLAHCGEVVAIDPMPEAIQRCRDSLGPMADWRVASIENLETDGGGFDSIVVLNVLEHIEDDLAALRTMTSLLRPGGHIALLVPAMPWLYGSLDHAFGHHRRYTRRNLASLLHRAGLEPQRLGYFNMLGVPGWLVAGKILGMKTLRAGLLRLYRWIVRPFRWIEDRFAIPFGLSILAVARRRS